MHIICGKISCLMCERVALSEFEIIRNEHVFQYRCFKTFFDSDHGGVMAQHKTTGKWEDAIHQLVSTTATQRSAHKIDARALDLQAPLVQHD